jgi:hypothetical protein
MSDDIVAASMTRLKLIINPGLGAFPHSDDILSCGNITKEDDAHGLHVGGELHVADASKDRRWPTRSGSSGFITALL